MPPFGWGSYTANRLICLILGITGVAFISSSVGKTFRNSLPFSLQWQRLSSFKPIWQHQHCFFFLQNPLHHRQSLAIDAETDWHQYCRKQESLSTSISPCVQLPKRRTRIPCAKAKNFLLQVSRFRAGPAGFGFSHHPRWMIQPPSLLKCNNYTVKSLRKNREKWPHFILFLTA